MSHPMKPNNSRNRTLLPVLMAALTLGLNALVVTLAAGQTPQLTQVPNGEKLTKHRGIVSKRSGEMFLIGDTTNGPQTMVVLTPETKVKSHNKGLLRGS